MIKKDIEGDYLKKVGAIGAGAAGMIAAATAADRGLDVVLLEKQHRVGRRTITGGCSPCAGCSDRISDWMKPYCGELSAVSFFGGNIGFPEFFFNVIELNL